MVDVEEAVVQLDFLLEESTTDLAGVVVQGLSVKSEIETKGFAVEVVETQKLPCNPYKPMTCLTELPELGLDKMVE